MAISATRVKYLDQSFHSATSSLDIFKNNFNINSPQFLNQAINGILNSSGIDNFLKNNLGLDLGKGISELKNALSSAIKDFIGGLNGFELNSMLKDLLGEGEIMRLIGKIDPSMLLKYGGIDNILSMLPQDKVTRMLINNIQRCLRTSKGYRGNKQRMLIDLHKLLLELNNQICREIAQLNNKQTKPKARIYGNTDDKYGYKNSTKDRIYNQLAM